MKLNLGCGADVRKGFINIDLLPPGKAPQDIYRQGDIASLDWITEDNTIDEILALNCLEYLPVNVMQKAIINWSEKLSVGGVLKILALDCHAAARSFAQGQLKLQEYLQAIFGTQNQGDNKLSAIDAITLVTILQGAKLDISLKRYEGISLYVEAIKC